MSGRRRKQDVQEGPAKQSAFQTASLKAGIPHSIGKGAIEPMYRAAVKVGDGHAFTESIDLDGHFKQMEPHSSRWDYGIGVRHRDGAELAFWLEPHPASSTGEAAKMLQKLDWLKAKLSTAEFSAFKALCDATVRQGVNPYRWQATEGGIIRINARGKEARLLALKGLAMPARQVTLL